MTAIGEALALTAICAFLLFGCNEDLRGALAHKLSGQACVEVQK